MDGTRHTTRDVGGKGETVRVTKSVEGIGKCVT